MTLLQKIKDQQLLARKEGSENASLLTTLLSESANVGKSAGNRDSTDDEVVGVIKKFIKNIDETIFTLSVRSQDTTKFEKEREVLLTFLPKQLTNDELLAIAKTKTSMPEFMKFLKENYNGQYDGKSASTIAKTVF